MAMTYKQIAKMIKDIGIPFAYYQFDEDTGIAPPFICYFYEGNDDMHADDSNYQKIENLDIELYTRQKDFTLEASIESALKNAGLVYSREETSIDDEKLYEVIFYTSVLIMEE